MEQNRELQAMEEMKNKLIEYYREAADQTMSALKGAETASDSYDRELFAEVFGRRQAYARVLKELFNVPDSDLQSILDEITTMHKRGS